MDATSDEGSTRVLEGGSRKRQKITRENGQAASLPAPVNFASNGPASLDAGSAPPHVANTPCLHEELLKTLNVDLEAMRQLVTCKICQRFLYQPYALACGHTFCYSCLNQWIGPNKKKTCPDCRNNIRQQPTPSYLIREMVLVFIGRRELLPDGETVEEHQQWAKEEADIVNEDRNNTNGRTGGLFKGCFGQNGRLAFYAIRDQSDNVDRCPQCLAEVEDGYCNTCNVRVRNENDDSDDSDSLDPLDQLDHDLDDLDADADLGLDGRSDEFDDYDYDVDDEDIPYAYDVFDMFDDVRSTRDIPLLRRVRRSERPSSDESDEDSSDEHHSLDGFIIDDTANVDGDSESSSDATEIESTAARRPRRRPAARIVLSDDDDDEDEPTSNSRRRQTSATTRPDASNSAQQSSSEDDAESAEESEDEAPVRTGRQRNKRQQRGRASRPIDVDSDDDEDDENGGSSDSSESAFAASATAAVTAEFSPLHDRNGDDDDENYEDYDDNEEGDDTDGYGRNDQDDESNIQGDPYEDEDGHDTDGTDETDEPTYHYWWGSMSSARKLTGMRNANHFIDPSANLVARPSDPANARLGTLQQRRNRYVDAVATQPPSPSSPRLPRQRNVAPPPAITNPVHPFQLSNTLASIANTYRAQPQSARVSGHCRDASASSHGSAAGGVDVSSPSSDASSGGDTARVGKSRHRARNRRRTTVPTSEDSET